MDKSELGIAAVMLAVIVAVPVSLGAAYLALAAAPSPSNTFMALFFGAVLLVGMGIAVGESVRRR